MAYPRTTPLTLVVSLLIILCSSAQAQQMGDPNFNPRIDDPAYPEGKGPIVLIDGAHNNFHTAEGRYRRIHQRIPSERRRVGHRQRSAQKQSKILDAPDSVGIHREGDFRGGKVG